MEQYIRITNINDFLFCPRFLYLHSIYEGYDSLLYHDEPQIVGTQIHAAVDERRYSSSKHILQGMAVTSAAYGLVGKIDIYDAKKTALIERKIQVKVMHEGYKLQLYAQYVCMREMGYDVLFLYVQSIKDNKRHAILPPAERDLSRLKEVLTMMRHATPALLRNHRCNRCENHIYESLGW